ncbi:MAG: O-antigen ligase family protein [Chloroflexi bacterium]|nr:O-antigen ligase family protein [Chloroflexota bacterium]
MTAANAPLGYPRTIAHSLTVRRWAVLSDWTSTLYVAALVVGFVLPFEAIPPLISTPRLGLTDDKLVLMLLVVAWVISGALSSRGWNQVLPTRTEWRLLLASLVFICVTLSSARLAAPEYADEALRFVARLLVAAFLMLVAMRLGADARHLTGLLWSVALGAGLSALLGIGESLHWSGLEPALALFKVAPTRVGGDLRVSASFQYATIAAMYFEMVAPLAIVLGVTARRAWTQVLGVAIAIACTANVVLSLTRAGMLTLAAIYATLILVGCARSSLRRVLPPALASGLVLLGGAILLLVHDPVFDLRLQTESDADWYGAAYSAPATLNLQADHTAIVAVSVRNEGRIPWTNSGNHPFALGYRWLTDDGNGVLDVPAAEVPLPHDVQPGESIQLQANLSVPDLPAGTYRLDWGMLQRDVLQFYERGWADAQTRVSITPGGVPATLPEVSPRDDDEAPWVVGRMDLWGAAARLIAAHPLLGVGPDNFRHYYGAELGLEAWDERVQANNIYLEILADLGVLGLAAFAWVIGGPLVAAARGARRGAYLGLGVGLAIVAFLVHGWLDSFLAFNPTAWLLWLLLGVASSAAVRQKPQVSGR